MKVSEKLGIADQAAIDFENELYEKFSQLDKEILADISCLAEKYIRKTFFETFEKDGEFFKRLLKK